MKVAYLALAPFISGAERSLQLLIATVKTHGIKPILLSPADSPMHGWAEQNNIPSFEIDLCVPNLGKPFGFIKNQLTIAKLLHKKNIAILHSNQIWSIRAANQIRKLLGVKMISHFRDPINQTSGWWLKGGIDGAICISNHIEQELITNVSSHLIGRCATIINPVQFPEKYSLAISKEKRQQRRTQLGINNEDFVFSFVGQISEVKGIIELITAFSQQSIPRSSLIVAGKASQEQRYYEQDCLSLIKQLNLENRIKLIGFKERISDVYEVSNVIVMPSKVEPLGRVPLEAASYYRPTIATAVGGLPETILDKKTGWLVPAGNINALVQAMQNSANANLNEMGEHCYAFAKQVACPEQYAKHVIEFYESILKMR